MSRPHEDRRRHTLVDHRTGGSPITFAPGAWCAVEVLHVTADRADATISSYETLVERARASIKGVRAAVLFRSHDYRRVIVLVHLEGHEAFRHLAASWDHHHILNERHAVAESRDLALYSLLGVVGEDIIDPESSDAYAFEHVLRDVERAGGVIDAGQGSLGAHIFAADDRSASVIVYRFEHAEQIEAFRQTPDAQRALGVRGGTGETFALVHPVRTFV
jgi:heme-degrading monooxygenase HmoA